MTATTDPVVLAEVLDGLISVVRELAPSSPLARRRCDELRNVLHDVQAPPAPPPPPPPMAERHVTHPDGSTSDGHGGPAPKPAPPAYVRVSPSQAAYEAVDQKMREREAARLAREAPTPEGSTK